MRIAGLHAHDCTVGAQGHVVNVARGGGCGAELLHAHCGAACVLTIVLGEHKGRRVKSSSGGGAEQGLCMRLRCAVVRLWSGGCF